jgi:SAM-dependent methyltransferase
MDELAGFKEIQKQGWAHFAPLESVTTPAAARLVKHAGVRPGQRVLDVACGTGVVAVTAARLGARVTGLDFTPELLDRARENSRIAEVDVDWHEGDAEDLPFDDEAFDVVLSQYGHIFAPRPAVVTAGMLRVLKRGGTIAFSTWPPELMFGRTFALIASYMPPPSIDVPPPPLWGDPTVVRERLGDAVRDIVFARAKLAVPTLSPQHSRATFERTAGPVRRLVELLGRTDPARLAAFRREYETLLAGHIQDNVVHQDYLLTRATKI